MPYAYHVLLPSGRVSVELHAPGIVLVFRSADVEQEGSPDQIQAGRLCHSLTITIKLSCRPRELSGGPA